MAPRSARRPFVSVVMPTLNAMPRIEKALDSARSCLLDAAFEIVVADGGSTDGTVAYLRSAGVRLIEGADDSLYEGLNRAVAAARGDYLLWLNADDVLAPEIDALVRLARAKSPDMVTGNAQIVSGDKVVWQSAHHRDRMSARSVLFGVPTINSRLVSAAALARTGPYRTDIGLAADRQMLLRLLEACPERVCDPAVVCRYTSHPGSLTIAGGGQSRRRVHEANMRLADAQGAEEGPEGSRAVYGAFKAYSRLAHGAALAATGGRVSGARHALAAVLASPREAFRGLALHRGYGGRGSGW